MRCVFGCPRGEWWCLLDGQLNDRLRWDAICCCSGGWRRRGSMYYFPLAALWLRGPRAPYGLDPFRADHVTEWHVVEGLQFSSGEVRRIEG